MCDYEEQPRDPEFEEEQEVLDTADSQHEDSAKSETTDIWTNSQGEIEALDDSTANESEWQEEAEEQNHDEDHTWNEEQHEISQNESHDEIKDDAAQETLESEDHVEHEQVYEALAHGQEEATMLVEDQSFLDGSKQQYIVVQDGNGEEQVYAVVQQFADGMEQLADGEGAMGVYEIHNGDATAEEQQEQTEDTEQVEWLEEGTSEDGSQTQEDMEATLTALDNTNEGKPDQVAENNLEDHDSNSTDDLLKLLGGEERQITENTPSENNNSDVGKKNIRINWREGSVKVQTSRPVKRNYEDVRVTSGTVVRPRPQKVNIKIRQTPPEAPARTIVAGAVTAGLNSAPAVHRKVARTVAMGVNNHNSNLEVTPRGQKISVRIPNWKDVVNNLDEQDTMLWDSVHEDDSSVDQDSDCFLDTLSSSSEDEDYGFSLDVRKEVASQLLPLLGRDAPSLLGIQKKQLKPMLESVFSERSKIKNQLRESAKEIRRLKEEISSINDRLNKD